MTKSNKELLAAGLALKEKTERAAALSTELRAAKRTITELGAKLRESEERRESIQALYEVKSGWVSKLEAERDLASDNSAYYIEQCNRARDARDHDREALKLLHEALHREPRGPAGSNPSDSWNQKIKEYRQSMLNTQEPWQ